MCFLIDADLPRNASALLGAYHTAADIRDLGMRRSTGPEIAAYAQRERLCLLTADWGFSDIRQFPPEQYHGIVILGLAEHSTGSDTLEVLRVLLEQPAIANELPGRLAASVAAVHRSARKPQRRPPPQAPPADPDDNVDVAPVGDEADGETAAGVAIDADVGRVHPDVPGGVAIAFGDRRERSPENSETSRFTRLATFPGACRG